MDNFFPRQRMRCIEMAGIQSKSESIKNLRVILKQRFRKQTVIWKSTEKFSKNLEQN